MIDRNQTRLTHLPNTLAAFTAGAAARTATPNSNPHWIVAAYKADDIRQTLMSEIDQVTRSEADRILTFTHDQDAGLGRPKVWDVFTVGTGWCGVVTTAKINSRIPNAQMLMVDENKVRGGSFRDRGLDYLFNSPTEGENKGLPGELSGPNYLGADVLLQIGDLTDDNYPYKSVAGEAFAIDGFVVGPAIPEAKVTEIHATGDPSKPYRITLVDTRSRNIFHFYALVVVLATGQGRPAWGFDISQPKTRKALKDRSDRIFLNDEFRDYLPRHSAQEILEMVQNGLAFGGGRDGTNTAVRYIISRLREILSDDEINQLSINIYGAHYKSADDFTDVMGTHVYNDLIPFIGKLLNPIEAKVTGLADAPNAVGVGLETGEQSNVGIYCASAGYSDVQLQYLLHTVSGDPEPTTLENILGDGELADEIIARKVTGQDIYVVGVAARVKKPKRTGKSLRTFGRAIRKHAPRVLAAADVIANALLRQKHASREHESVSLV